MKLSEIFTQNTFVELPSDKLVYSRDASEFEGICTGVVWPTSKDHIVNMIKFALKENPHFTIRGAGTNKVGACVPSKSLVIDMSRMNHIIEWGYDYVIVESGVILNDLLKATKKHNLIFPINLLESNACTIGGLIAMNAQGLNSYYGRMEDYVLELEVIDGQGNKIKTTNIKDFAGMEGTTGLIWTAKLKLLSTPIQKSISIFKFNTIKSLIDKAVILDKFNNILSMQMYDELSSSFLGLDASYHLIVEYSNDSGLIKNEEEIAKLDEMKEKLQHILINKKFTIKEDPKISLEEMPKFLHWLQKNGVPCYGNLKDKILFPCFRENSKLQEEMYIIVKSVNGEIPGFYGIGIKRKKFISSQMKNKVLILKNKYDPLKVFNRGVIID